MRDAINICTNITRSLHLLLTQINTFNLTSTYYLTVHAIQSYAVPWRFEKSGANITGAMFLEAQ